MHLVSGGHLSWECPNCSRAMRAVSPLERDSYRSSLFQWLFICVTLGRVIHTTRIDSRDLGFSLTDNWCVVWDPPLVAQLYCSSYRCLTSHRPHDIVEDTSVHSSDYRLTTLQPLGSRASRDTGPRHSRDPPYVGPLPLGLRGPPC